MKRIIFYYGLCSSSIRVMRFHVIQTACLRSQKCCEHSSSTRGITTTFSTNGSSPSFDAGSRTGTSGVLPGIDLGMRVAQPSSEFPATLSEEEPLPANDPRVEWKEHFCSEKERPYYHNLRTNVVVYNKPLGFVTRFPRWYQRNTVHDDLEKTDPIDSGGISTSNGQASSSSIGAPSHQDIANGIERSGESRVRNIFFSLTKKKQLAANGATGLLWYLIVHNFFLACVFSSMYFLNIDLVSIARSYGFHVSSDEGKSREAEKVNRPSFWKTLITAIVLNKLLVPVQVVVTIGTGSRVIPVLQIITKKLSRRFPLLFSKSH